MSNDRSSDFSETESRGWLSRLGNAFLGIPIGVILFIASFVILFWNEGRAVHTAQSLSAGEKAVISISSDTVDHANEGKLVHVSGLATTDQTLKDPQFDVSAQALQLRRNVQMFQWKEDSQTETRRKLGGGEERVTRFTYSKIWSEPLIDSSRFKVTDGHENPTSRPFEPWSTNAEVVTLGAFRLPTFLVDRLTNFEPLRVDSADLGRLPNELKSRIKVDDGRYYLGDNPRAPQIGDLRIEFRVVRPTVVSLLEQQVGNSFQPFPIQGRDSIDRLQVGTVSAVDMFQAAEEENTLWTWLLRLIGFACMALGIGLVLRPLAVFGDVVPLIGDVIRFGTGLVATVLALVLSLVTIALGWIVYRPVVGIILLALAGVTIGIALWVRSRRRPRPAQVRTPTTG